MPFVGNGLVLTSFFRVMSPTIPTAGGAGVVSQIGSGANGWMLRVVNVDLSRKTCSPLRQGEEVGLGHHPSKNPTNDLVLFYKSPSAISDMGTCVRVS